MDWTEKSIVVKADAREIKDLRWLLIGMTLITVSEDAKWWRWTTRITITGPRWKLDEVESSVQRMREDHWWADQW